MKRAIVILFVLACTVAVFAEDVARPSHPELLQGIKSIESAPALEEWLNFYYLHPRPDLAPSAFARMNENGLLAREEMRPGITSFFAALLHSDPKLGPQLVGGARGADARVVLAQAAWLSNNDAATDVLDALGKSAKDEEKKALKEMTYRKPPDILSAPIRTEWDLDALWATFFATGDTQVVSRIASAVSWATNSDPVLRSIGEQARRTLVKNGSEHPRVLVACEADMARATNPQKDALAAVLTEARAQANRTH